MRIHIYSIALRVLLLTALPGLILSCSKTGSGVHEKRSYSHDHLSTYMPATAGEPRVYPPEHTIWLTATATPLQDETHLIFPPHQSAYFADITTLNPAEHSNRYHHNRYLIDFPENIILSSRGQTVRYRLSAASSSIERSDVRYAGTDSTYKIVREMRATIPDSDDARKLLLTLMNRFGDGSYLVDFQNNEASAAEIPDCEYIAVYERNKLIDRICVHYQIDPYRLGGIPLNDKAILSPEQRRFFGIVD
ncbi:MAG: hypothetical protein LAT67_08920 [Balneolales bacterium]|nr:hypothetical protein [Balneolales bacterium]